MNYKQDSTSEDWRATPYIKTSSALSHAKSASAAADVVAAGKSSVSDRSSD